MSGEFSELRRASKMFDFEEIEHMTPAHELIDKQIHGVSVVQAYFECSPGGPNSLCAKLLLMFLDENEKSISLDLWTEIGTNGKVKSFEAFFGVYFEDSVDPDDIVKFSFSITYDDNSEFDTLPLCNKRIIDARYHDIEIDYKTEKLTRYQLQRLNTSFNGKYVKLRSTLTQEELIELAARNHKILSDKLSETSVSVLTPIIQKLKSLIPVFDPRIRKPIKTITHEFHLWVRLEESRAHKNEWVPVNSEH